MKVICNRGALLEALVVAGTVVAARTPKPVLQCVKLSAQGNQLTVSATDLEVSIEYHDAQVEIGQPGDMLLPADKLRDIVRESIDDTLTIEAEGETATIKGQDSVFKIFTQAVEGFPPIPAYEGEPDFTVTAGQLKQLIAQSAFAAAREASRYAINGVLVNVKGKRASLVATDGRRLAEARGDLISIGTKLEKDGARAIIPIKALGMIDKLLGDPEEAVACQLRENQVIIRTSKATLTANLVEGQFPPYETVIPNDGDKRMTASTADLLSAVRRSSLLYTEETKGVKFSFSKKGLVLASSAPGAGESRINFPCKFDGADVEIGFNPAFMVEALKVVDTDEVTLELAAGNRPGLLKGGPNFQYVLMPVNL